MRTLDEHLDDLDRLVDGNGSKAEVRSQIALIGREVAALEADYARLAEAHTKLQAAKAEVDKQLSDMNARRKNELDDWVRHAKKTRKSDSLPEEDLTRRRS